MATMQKPKRLRPDLIPPVGAVPVGLHTDGRMIYEMQVRDHEATAATKVQIKDAKGEPLFRKDAQGNPYPVMTVSKEIMRTSRFVLTRSPAGKVSSQEGFEPSKAEIAQDKMAADRNKFLDSLAEQAAKRGLSPEDLVSRLLDPIKEAGPGQVLIEEDYPIHRGGNAWILSSGTNFYGNRKGAEKAEKQVSDKSFEAEPVEVEALSGEF